MGLFLCLSDEFRERFLIGFKRLIGRKQYYISQFETIIHSARFNRQFNREKERCKLLSALIGKKQLVIKNEVVLKLGGENKVRNIYKQPAQLLRIGIKTYLIGRFSA